MPVMRYADYTSGTGPSPGIWGHIQEEDQHNWISLWNDFDESVITLSSSGHAGRGLYVYLDTGDTTTAVATETGGVYRLTTGTGDNDGPVLTTGYNVAGLVKFTAGKPLAWEARIRTDSITTCSIFCGLTEEARAVNNGLFPDAQTAVADIDYVGFATLGDTAASTLNAMYTTSGSTDATPKSGAQTLVADTWYKLGVRFDPYIDKVIWYVDGAPVSGQTATSISATVFPDGEELAFSLGIKNGSGAARNLDIDWFKVAMMR